MAEVKLLKIASGLPTEIDSTSDDVTMNSFTVNGGPALSSTGLDMNDTSVTEVDTITFQDVNGTIAGIENQNLLDKTADESITGKYDLSGGDMVLPTGTDGTPSEGSVRWDGTADKLYIWDGSAWADQAVATEALHLERDYTAGTGGIAQYDAVYISANDTVLKAIADGTSKSYCVGFAPNAITAAATGAIRDRGTVEALTTATAGAPYYLDDTTAGAVTATAPSASGKDVVRVGFAKNATTLLIDIQYIGKRA